MVLLFCQLGKLVLCWVNLVNLVEQVYFFVLGKSGFTLVVEKCEHFSFPIKVVNLRSKFTFTFAHFYISK